MMTVAHRDEMFTQETPHEQVETQERPPSVEEGEEASWCLGQSQGPAVAGRAKESGFGIGWVGS